MKKPLGRAQQPSGVYRTPQTHFPYFQIYIAYCQHLIEQARLDLNDVNKEQIVFANSPFEHTHSTAKKGVLLLHGLYDSPCMMRSLSDYFVARGFNVRAVLLPGQGTVPGDLLEVKYQEWIDSAEYGMRCFEGEVDELYVAGFSMGGVLATYLALLYPERVRALLLWAPAFVLRPMLRVVAYGHRLLQGLLPDPQWLTVMPEIDYAKYASFCVNSLSQLSALIKKVNTLWAKQALLPPSFWVVAQGDEVLQTEALLKLFLMNTSMKSELIYYSQKEKIFSDARLSWRSSRRPDEKIVDFSHVALPIAPSHFHYGVEGDYSRQLLMTLGKQNRTVKYYGSLKNIQLANRRALTRLTYNPDFYYMTQRMDCFLDKL